MLGAPSSRLHSWVSVLADTSYSSRGLLPALYNKKQSCERQDHCTAHAGASKPPPRRGGPKLPAGTSGGITSPRASRTVLNTNNSFPGGSMQRGDSLLMELSQGLSAPAAPSGPASTGMCLTLYKLIRIHLHFQDHEVFCLPAELSNTYWQTCMLITVGKNFLQFSDSCPADLLQVKRDVITCHWVTTCDITVQQHWSQLNHVRNVLQAHTTSPICEAKCLPP